MITTKQRAALRKAANSLQPVFQVGKGGLTDAVTDSISVALTARELVKVRVLETSPVSAREACDAVCAALGADPVQVVGRVFVVYLENPEIRAFADLL